MATALFTAALGDEETVSLLLEKGALPNALDSADRAALHVAAENGRLAAVSGLLAAGADTSLRYGKVDFSVLVLGAAKGHVEIVAALIRSGADVDATDSTGSTALHKAACCNKTGVIDLLVGGGATVDAAEYSFGWVPLHCASRRCCFEATECLLKNGARVEELDNGGRSPLHWTAIRGHLPATIAILAAGGNVNAADNARCTALHLAAREGYQHVSRVLVQAGADVNATDSAGCTALYDAATILSDAGTVVRALIEAGTTVDEPGDGGWTPLHMCALRPNELEAMDVLLECGANPNAQDSKGRFPLHLVISILVRKDVEDTVVALLRWGADETALNRNGQTPLEVAEERFGVDGVGRLRDLLKQASLDGNWRRRGWFLLYRAYPRRMRPIPGTGAAPSDRSKKCRAGSVSTEAAGGTSVVRGGAEGGVPGGGGDVPGDWSGAVTWVMGMELEGVFRNVVEYL